MHSLRHLLRLLATSTIRRQQRGLDMPLVSNPFVQFFVLVNRAYLGFIFLQVYLIRVISDTEQSSTVPPAHSQPMPPRPLRLTR